MTWRTGQTQRNYSSLNEPCDPLIRGIVDLLYSSGLWFWLVSGDTSVKFPESWLFLDSSDRAHHKGRHCPSLPVGWAAVRLLGCLVGQGGLFVQPAGYRPVQVSLTPGRGQWELSCRARGRIHLDNGMQEDGPITQRSLLASILKYTWFFLLYPSNIWLQLYTNDWLRSICVWSCGYLQQKLKVW